MKKAISIFIIVLLGYSLLPAQSIDIETTNLSKRYANHEFDAYEFKKLAKSWNDLNEKYGYPEIPYDTISKTFKYVFVVNFDNINKETIYNRILENASMNYDYLANITDYQDYKSGKIILKVRNPIQSNNGKTLYLSYASRFVVLENKLKIEVFKMSIDYHYDAYDNGTAILTNYEKSFPLEDYFPITSVKEKYWEDRLKQLIQFNETIRNSNLELIRFIKSYQNDYNF